MKKLINTMALLTITSNFATAGHHIKPTEPTTTMHKKEVVVVDNNVKYNGFYLGGGLTYLLLNDAVELRGVGLTFIGGYYLNQYLGFEARYTTTIDRVDIDTGAHVHSKDIDMTNLGLYIKPMYNLTTGFSFYGLAGYGQAKADNLEEDGFQWGLGAKYELSNGVGLFFDYMNLYDGDNFDGTEIDNTFYNTTSFGALYTF
ncbi:MAG: hypothetical protein DSZ09_05495 [Sulfurovum sp.]|nr:MAG: hypothetical protein DSZ09_05495 [Sulfurovum sp.]